MNKYFSSVGKSGGGIRSKMVILTLLLIVAVPGVASAKRPLVTDDAGTIGKGTMQVELGVETSTHKETEDGSEVKETGTEISGVFAYGVTETLDLMVGFPYSWNRTRENGETVFNANRLADISLEAKWHFLERNGFGLTLKPCVTLPSGDHEKGFGTGRATYGLTFIASQELEPFAFHFNAGYTRNENKLEEREDIWSLSFAGEYAVLKSLTLVGNVGMERNADPDSSTNPAFVLAGLIYSINKHVSLDAGVKFGLNKKEVDHAIIAGITMAF